MSVAPRVAKAAKDVKRKAPTHLWLAGGSVVLGTIYSTYQYITYHKDASEAVKSLDPDAGRTFEQLSDIYDKAVGVEETWMGFGLLRWWLMKYAEGDVLEISAGTGRNMPYYNFDRVNNITFTDLSPGMLKQAENKYFDELRMGFKHPNTKVTFALADAHCLVKPEEVVVEQRPGFWGRMWGRKAAAPPTPDTPAPPTPSDSTSSGAGAAVGGDEGGVRKGPTKLSTDGGSCFNLFRVLVPGGLESRPKSGATPCKDCPAHQFTTHYKERCECGRSDEGLPLVRFEPGTFDTVVDAFGLCSHDDPVLVLRQAARLCKPDGKIILMEHGQASFKWWNRSLDQGADDHRQKWGCWWNRDILAIVRQAGLEIESVSRWHFGTTYLIIARP